MKDSTKKIIFTVLAGLPTLLVVWIFSLYFFGCGSTNSCTGIPQPDRTSIPTLLAATMPAPKVGLEAAAATPKCHITALNLIGAWVSAGYSEKDPFNFTDIKGTNCSATFKDDVQKLFLTPNLWYDGAPACTTCHYADVAKATKNMDLSSYSGIVAGSNRLNGAAKGDDILGGGKWTDALLYKMLYAPDGKTTINRPAMPLGRPATVPAEGPELSAGIPSSASTASTTAATPAATPGAASTGAPAVAPARPSNAGGPGDAVNQTGDAAAGMTVYTTYCAVCHGDTGKGGIANAGSTDGTVPPLNPIDPSLIDQDLKTYATNLDLFIQHGSTPEGPSPAKTMTAWGDTNALSQKQIADVIAYIIQLNPAAATAGATPTGAPAVAPARPSNSGGPGDAVNQTGDATAGMAVYNTYCAVCHGDTGKGGIANAGSTDGTVPPLNPIDPSLIDQDLKTYATNLDLFIQHGSTPEGPSPAKTMTAWGDTNALSQKQIADVIAYIIQLNPAAATPGATPTGAPAVAPARPSNSGGPGDAVNQTGDAAAGMAVYTTYCAVCHGDTGKGGIANAGSTDGTVPPLNPIDPTLIDQDLKTYATNLDLFIQHGSTPEGPSPAKTMTAWGDTNALSQKQIADVIAYIIQLNPAAATAGATPTGAPAVAPARPSNSGGPGDAVNQTGDATAGMTVYTTYCAVCHGDTGKGGIANPGSTDGTVPPLNPIDPTLIDKDLKTYATNLDLFIQHGSTPEGPSPAKTMTAWGDTNALSQKQIADVIAYIIKLNSPAPAATPTSSAPEIARPSNPGGAGLAITLKGDIKSGLQVYTQNCASCHGEAGKVGVANPGSTDGTVPGLNPIDDTIKTPSLLTFAYNIDLFVEHGSTPAGTAPTLKMPAWGDLGNLTPQQIADVIAYVISLNK